jgi:hypothetical protein
VNFAHGLITSMVYLAALLLGRLSLWLVGKTSKLSLWLVGKTSKRPIVVDWEGAKESAQSADVATSLHDADAAMVGVQRIPYRAENSLQRKTETAVFHSDGYPMPVRKAWGDIPYDELSPMFLDQFLLRYFAPLLSPFGPFMVNVHLCVSPWEAFVMAFPWAKEMPLLFEQLTGYKLNDLQLNNAIAEYVGRLTNSQRAAGPIPPDPGPSSKPVAARAGSEYEYP